MGSSGVRQLPSGRWQARVTVAGDRVGLGTFPTKRAGVYEMPREHVFRVEELLHLQPGFLSRHLGYLPLEQTAAPATVEESVLADPLLNEDARHTLLALYRHLIGWTSDKPKPAKGRRKAASST